jgi:hypothetical protein
MTNLRAPPHRDLAKCPLWVISGHWGAKQRCPLCSRRSTPNAAMSLPCASTSLAAAHENSSASLAFADDGSRRREETEGGEDEPSSSRPAPCLPRRRLSGMIQRRSSRTLRSSSLLGRRSPRRRGPRRPPRGRGRSSPSTTPGCLSWPARACASGRFALLRS